MNHTSTFLFLALALAAGAAQAQTSPSITSADMPQIGDSLRLSQTALVLPASAPPLTRNGANQTWNYAGLVATAQRVERFANVNTATGTLLQLTFNSAFSPNTRATLVSPQNLPLPAGTPLPITDPLQFFNASATDYRSVGYGGTLTGLAVPVTYTTKAQQDVIYRFPLSFSGTSVSNSELTTPALVATTGYFSQQRQRTYLADAWGTLTTPFGTFQTVRVVTKLVDHDSIALAGAPGVGLDLPVSRTYQWLAKGIHVPVLSITTTEIAAGQEVVSAVEYRDVFRRFVTLAARDAATDAVLSAYPNPSAVGTALRLAVPAGSGPLTIAATDLLGRQLFSQQFGSSPGGVVTLAAAAFGDFRGVLLLTVTTTQGTATRRVVRE